MSEEEIKTLLPDLFMRASWDTRAGLVVSPFNRPLPLEVAEQGLPKTYADWHIPRLVPDSLIYVGFYPKEWIARGALLGVLDVEGHLSDLIVQDGRKWCLEENTRKGWEKLEMLMLQIYKLLFKHHELYAFLPNLQLPDLPDSYGYTRHHDTQKEALKAARRALPRFPLLSAVCTFALSLWLNPYLEDAFDRAFELLEAKGVNPTVLQHLKDSPICDLSRYLRTGCFLNANTTQWGRIIYRIGRAGAPLWVVWGFHSDFRWTSPASATMGRYFLPPYDFILALEARATGSSVRAPLPRDEHSSSPPQPVRPRTPENRQPVASSGTSNDRNDDFYQYQAFDNEDPIEPAAKTVPPRSLQRPGETWDEFMVRMKEGRERANQDPNKAAAMRGREVHAAAVREGKAWISKKSKVFCWERDPYHQDYYVRTPLDDPEAEWGKLTTYQRFYWSQVDQWDFVEHIARYPDHVPMDQRVNVEDLDDPEDPMFDMLRSRPPPEVVTEVAAETLRATTNAMVKSLRQRASQRVLGTEYTAQHMAFLTYLRLRHGFNVDTLHNKSTYLWGKKSTLPPNEWSNVGLRFNFPAFVHEPGAEAHAVPLVDFYNTLMGAFEDVKLSNLDALPPNWDLRANFVSQSQGFIQIQCANAMPWQEFLLQQEQNTLQHTKDQKKGKTSKLYIMRPARGSKEKSPWFVATTDATTVLFVLRRGLTSMSSIASALLEQGIPFRTVEERGRDFITPLRANDPPAYMMKVHPQWQPELDDYVAYREGRQDLLGSYLGRSLRARGGIVGRMAADVVPDIEVLSGPARCDEIVGVTSQGSVFVDDYVPRQAFDKLAGMYLIPQMPAENARATAPVKKARAKAPVKMLSYWPTQERWMGSGFCGDMWSPRVETWYKARQSELEGNTITAKDGKAWKNHIEGFRKQVYLIEGSRNLAALFLEKRLHVSFKWL